MAHRSIGSSGQSNQMHTLKITLLIHKSRHTRLWSSGCNRASSDGLFHGRRNSKIAVKSIYLPDIVRNAKYLMKFAEFYKFCFKNKIIILCFPAFLEHSSRSFHWGASRHRDVNNIWQSIPCVTFWKSTTAGGKTYEWDINWVMLKNPGLDKITELKYWCG